MPPTGPPRLLRRPSEFFEAVKEIAIYWSPYHPTSSVAQVFLSRVLGPKFRRNNPELIAKHYLWAEPQRPAYFEFHIDDGSKDGYKFAKIVPTGFSPHEFEHMIMKERETIEADRLRETIFYRAQNQASDEDSDGYYYQPDVMDLNIDYKAAGKIKPAHDPINYPIPEGGD